MSTILSPPDAAGADQRESSSTGRTPPPADHDGRRSSGGWPGRRSLAILLTTAALLGGAAGTGLLAATGALDDNTSTTTTVVRSSTSGASDGSSTTVDAAAVYDSAAAGVVEITATGSGSSQSDPFGQGSAQTSSTGSGFVVDGDGYIVTAAHVVDRASSIEITFSDGTTRRATLVGQDNATDVAVVKVDPSGLQLHPLELGRSASLDVGDAVVAIGSPFGYEESVSTGVVSGLDRTIEAPNGYSVAHAVQTDAALNPGNSGGPILDSSGRVVGIADQIATSGSSEQSSGVGFAVPIDLIAGELDQLKAGETVSHAYLGVSTTDSAGTTGAQVAEVASGSPAADAGMKTGDIVTAIDGTQITGPNDLVSAIGDHKPGDRIELTVRRGSDTHTLIATLDSQPNTRSSLSTG
jgi:putative serine protease PepD